MCSEDTLELAKEVGREIVRQNGILVTGATTGIPYWAAIGAKEEGGISLGISPAASEIAHVKSYKLPIDYYDLIMYTGFEYSGRNLLLIRSSDAVINVCGRIGTLNEFTIAFEDKKVIGVLEGTGGAADMIRDIVILCFRDFVTMIYIASDHAGYALKEILKKYLAELGESVTDVGPEQFNPEDDYPDYAAKLAQEMLHHDGRGILICGNAVGMCVAANKFRGIRAAIGYSVYAAQSSRADDDANVLCLPSRALSDDAAKEIMQTWLATPFSREERHKRRIAKIATLEREHIR